MPKGPEIKLSTNFLRKHVECSTVCSVQITPNSRYSKKYPVGFNEFIHSLSEESVKILDISCKGKSMFWTFSNGWYMFCSFGMSGQWILESGKHPCIVFNLNDNRQAVFNDPRHFGTIKFSEGDDCFYSNLNRLGWDPLGNDHCCVETIINKLFFKNKPIGQVLLDQAIFSGVGNYIRAESLYLAKISPWKNCKDLNRNDIINLCKCISSVMKESYQNQGATLLTYKTSDGQNGVETVS